jgi:hypothetical protein
MRPASLGGASLKSCEWTFPMVQPARISPDSWVDKEKASVSLFQISSIGDFPD